MIRRNAKKLKKAIANRLRATAKRLDPPIHPYGEWDPTTGKLVIRVPQAPHMALASIDIAPGMVQIGSEDIREYRL